MSKASKKKGAESPPLSSFECFFAAVESFVRSGSSFESSTAIDAAVADLGKCTSLQDAFAVPLQHKLFSMDGALRWALFLAVAPDHETPGGGPPFANGPKFSTQDAFDLIAAVYDAGVQAAVWDHFGEDEDDEEDEDADAADDA